MSVVKLILNTWKCVAEALNVPTKTCNSCNRGTENVTIMEFYKMF